MNSTGAKELAPGTRVDHFRVIRCVGRGAQGAVYLARDLRLGRAVALKMIAPDRRVSPYALERFVFEARATARLTHPNIVTVHAVGLYEKFPYLALEYIEGESLRVRITERSLGEKAALRVVLDIARAVAAAHRQGVLHRDLKPENVVMATDGRLRVVDFGVAKLIDVPLEDEPSPEVDAAPDIRSAYTAEGAGTPAYMSPEQWAKGEIAAPADVWALGVMTYELLLGRRPFVASTREVLQRMVTGSSSIPVLASETLSAHVKRILAQTLEREPEARPTIDALIVALEAELEGAPARDEEDNPFRGLLAFSERHASMFFGRDREVAAFVERLRDTTVLPVVGPSGAGKSSFVQAGVVPRLRERGRWTVLSMRPGVDPLGVLVDRLLGRTNTSVEASMKSSDRDTSDLAGGSTADRAAMIASFRESPDRLALELAARADRDLGSVLLVIDQLEELVTLRSDPTDAETFLFAVCNAARDPIERVRVVMTVRDDFLGRLPASPVVAAAFARSTILAPPGPEALLEAIVRPVRARGYDFDDEHLPKEMVANVREEAAALPLVQFACRALWEERDRDAKLIRRVRYERMGGVGGALAHHGDAVLGALADDELEAARTLLLRLVTPEGTRKTVARDDCVSGLGASGEGVLERLVDSRMIAMRRSSGGRTYELAHESLIENWGRLKRWIDGSREDIAFIAEIEQAAALWDRRGRSRDEAWTSDALTTARARLAHVVVSDRVRDFITAGVARERSRGRRRSALLAAAFLLLGGLAVVFYLGKQRAQVERRRAEVERAGAERESAALDLLRGDEWAARSKVRSALEIVDAVDARALWIRIDAERVRWRGPFGAAAVASTAGGDWIVLPWNQPLAKIDGRTFETTLRFGQATEAYTVAVDPRLRWVARGLSNGAVELLDMSGTLVRETRVHEGAVSRVAFDGNGDRMATTGWDGRVVLLSMPSLTIVKKFDGHGARASGVLFLPNGDLATTGWDGRLRIWGDDELSIDTGQGKVGHVSMSPDGATLATSGEDGTIALWRTNDGAEIGRIRAHALATSSTGFDPSGRWLMSSSWDRTIRFWDLETHTELGAPIRFDREIHRIQFGTDGTVAAILAGGDIAIVDARIAETDDPGPPPLADIVAIDSSERFIAVSAPDHQVVVRRASDGRVHRLLVGHTGTVRPVAFRPNTVELASSGFDRTIRIWDAETGALLHLLAGHRAPVSSLTYSSNGKVLASGGFDRQIRIWGADGEQLRRLEASGRVASLAFDAKDQTLAVGTFEGDIELFDVRAGASRVRYTCDSNRVVHRLGFDADNRLVAMCGSALHWFDEKGRDVRPPIQEEIEETCLSVAGHRILRSSGDRVVLEDDTQARVVQQRATRGCAFAPSATWFVTAEVDGPLRRFDTKTAAESWPHVPDDGTPLVAEGAATWRWSPDILVRGRDGGRAVVEFEGRALLTAQLHGALSDVRREGDTLLLTSEVGDHRALELTDLASPYCELLKRVYATSPSVWRHGASVPAPPRACPD